MKGDTVFKVRAYQRAARTIENLSFSVAQAVEEGTDLKKIPGIGKAIDDKIHELLETGRVSAYEKVLAELPDGVLSLMDVPGIGPKTAMLITQELGVSTIQGVEQAARDGRVASLPRMGEKAAENILRHINTSRTKDHRTPIGQSLPLAEEVIRRLREACPEIGALFPAGSLRRWEETIGDIDLVGTSPNPEHAGEVLASLDMVREVLVHGPKKTSVVVEPGMQVDLRLGDPESFGALLQYFTGSQQHNIRLRDYANRMGLSLNEYGITALSTGETEQFPDEAAFYARLGLPYIPPELRTGMWEVDAARDGNLPNLIEESHLRGDLHLHSDWSDGRDPIEAMVAAAAEQGYEYMALTDHSSGRGIANGLSNDRLLQQIALLRSLRSKYAITILCGSEVDIRADGTLDYPDELLEQLDVVVASVHSAMGQDSETMTQRIIDAMRHPSVTVIGHLSTRLLGRREPVEFDLEALLQAARDTGTAVEINASPERLDLRDIHAYRARELGVPAAAEQGYEYMALTDHSSGRGIANGLSNDRLLQQIALLRSLRSKYAITILCGSEVDIRADGTLDYPDELLEQLDVVVASVHSAMGQDSETMTQRIIDAMRHPSVTVIGHLSTRLLGRREPVEFDLEALLHAARDTGTALEINASPERLDLRDIHAYRARELGVPLVVSTDSHHYADLGQRRFGVAVARRAWCEPKHVLNTLPREQFLQYIRTPKPARTKLFDAALAESG